MSIRLIDIAEIAKVSKSTVSRALNNDKQINIETRKRIMKIASDLNYIPDYKAKSLAKNKTNILGLVVPTIDNLFFAEFVQAFKMRAREKNYNVILCTVGDSEEELKRYINMFMGGHVDAAVFAFIRIFPEELNELTESQMPVIYAGHYQVKNQMINNVLYLNLKEGCYQATKYLLQAGHRKLAFVGEIDDRYQGFKQALEESNLQINDDYIFLDPQDWFEIGNKIAADENRPSALVCYSDDIAISIIQSLSRAGVRIPADVSVCGFDNIKIANKYNPPLTTVNVPKKEMGEKAAEILLKKLENEEKEKKKNEEEIKISFDCQLIVRESTAVFNGGG